MERGRVKQNLREDEGGSGREDGKIGKTRRRNEKE